MMPGMNPIIKSKSLHLLIIGDFHHKNKDGLLHILEYINRLTPIQIHYKFVSAITDSDIQRCDIIYSPCNPINTALYHANKKFIFGPHFSVFPDNKLQIINNINNNSIYIQPSIQAMLVWHTAKTYLPITWFPFPVDTAKFSPITNTSTTTHRQTFPNATANTNTINIFIYYKRRHPNELTILLAMISNYNNSTSSRIKVDYRIFDYVQRYNEDDYLAYIRTCKYGIILDAHESQGFAIQEALSCNIPLLVWSSKTMSQEWNGYNYTYSGIEGQSAMISVPYWDARCGEIFFDSSELQNTFDKFISNIEGCIYQPREFILENLSVSHCATRFLALCGIYPIA
jgi:hypothetical protein